MSTNFLKIFTPHAIGNDHRQLWRRFLNRVDILEYRVYNKPYILDNREQGSQWKYRRQRRERMPREKFRTLTEQMFYTLLCLKEECYGMDILDRVPAMTGQRVKIGRAHV